MPTAKSAATQEPQENKKQVPLHRVVPVVPKGMTYTEMVEGKKRNPLIEKSAKQLLAVARKQLKAGAKKVKIMVNEKPTEVELVTLTSGWALVKDKSGDTYGIELDS